MRKSSLILLLAMAFVLTTAAAGFAKTVTDGPCYEPCKSWGYNLKILEYDTPGVQAPGDKCPVIDYEGAYGYCDDNIGDSFYNAMGILFKVCDCTGVDFDAEASYGIKIEILEPASGGVYFTNANLSQSSSNIVVASYPENAVTGEVMGLCKTTEMATPVELSYVPLNPAEDLYVPTKDACVPSAFEDLATAVQTTEYTPFMVKDLPYVLIDIPSMVWDPNVMNFGDKIVIRVTITGEGGTSVCPSCKDLCSCTIQIGVIGCGSTDNVPECYTCFPYFTALDDAAWWSGFALTNSGSDDADVVMTFTAGGDSVDVTLTVPAKTVMVKALSELNLTALSGKGPIYAMAVSTVPYGEDDTTAAMINGFAIMGDNAQAYGYLAKDGQKCGCTDCTDCK